MGAACCKEEAIDFTSEIELSHFHLLRSVGKGAFGKVRVVQHKKTKEIYALKYINKAKCIRMRAVENIVQERRLLEEVEFPLICNLRYAFQDDENLFMVLDLMLGGDLRFHLERAGPMREDVVRFYIAELALALDALHARRIVHRDLKPDNVLLDEHGHAHLTDFNIAVYYHPSKPLVSIAGSMAYMAPEVLLRKGYFESVDWWSLGVVMFELLFGKRPFRGKSNELLTNSILRDKLPFPDNVHEIASDNCLDVLSKLCERDISKRLGCTSEGLNAFKQHPWFHGMDWDKLVRKEAVPPFEPDSKRANFDATHELEELLMEDNPLKAKKRAQTSPETELSAEMQMMEDKFIVYDFTKVRRSHSLGRGKILRMAHEQHKSSSGTLDGAIPRMSGVANPSGGRTEHAQMMPISKSYRPASPSDRVGQERFNPEEDVMSNPDNRPSSPPPQLGQPVRRADSRAGDYNAEQDSVTVPASALPRPLQPRDQVTGIRAGSPQLYLNGNSHNTNKQHHHHQHQHQHHQQPASPSSPSNYSGHSTVTLATTPPTTNNSSPATHKSPMANMFSTMDSGTSLSSLQGSNSHHGSVDGTQPLLMDPALIPTNRRIIRGREASNHSVNSMPLLQNQQGFNYSPSTTSQRIQSPGSAAAPRRGYDLHHQASITSQYQRDQQMLQQQHHQQNGGRPMSAYTTSTSPGSASTVTPRHHQHHRGGGSGSGSGNGVGGLEDDMSYPLNQSYGGNGSIPAYRASVAGTDGLSTYGDYNSVFGKNHQPLPLHLQQQFLQQQPHQEPMSVQARH